MVRTPVVGSRWIVAGLFAGLMSGASAFAQTPAGQTQTPPAQGQAAQPAQQAQAAPTARVFASDAGLVLNFIKPDKTADFEAVMAIFV